MFPSCIIDGSTEGLDLVLLIGYGMGCSMGYQSVLGHKQRSHGGKQSLKVLYDELKTHEKKILKTSESSTRTGTKRLEEDFFNYIKEWISKKEGLGPSIKVHNGRRINPFGHGQIRSCILTQLREEAKTSL